MTPCTSDQPSDSAAAGTLPAYRTIRVTLEDGVAELVLSRPERKNAIDMTMRRELADLLSRLRLRRDVRVLLLTGDGGNFCSGGDIHAMSSSAAAGESTAEARRQRVMDVHGIVEQLLGYDRPVIAAVAGVAYGAGFALALMADLVLLADDARLCMSFARIGLVPDFGALYTLPRIVGTQRAKELVFSARELGAEEALRLGIGLEVHPAAALMGRARELARALTRASPVALSIAKRALDTSLASDLRTTLVMEADGQGIAMTSKYHAEAIQRFLAKEAPALVWPALRGTAS